MAGRDLAESAAERAVEGYLGAVAAGLIGPRRVRAAILDELRDGLHDAIATRVRRGEHPTVAMRSALAQFGAPEVMAHGFAGELAGSRARRTVAAYLSTGPTSPEQACGHGMILAGPAGWQTCRSGAWRRVLARYKPGQGGQECPVGPGWANWAELAA